MKFARGKYAFGFCDRCAQRYPLRQLREEIYDERPNGLRVCPSCFDEDHPQLQLDRVRADEVMSLKDPRPEKNIDAIRALFGWNPTTGCKAKVSVGTVRITTS